MSKYLLFFMLLFTVRELPAQGVLDKVKTAVQSVSGNSSKLSNEEIIGGLKEALQVGADSSVKKLGVADGFFKSAALKILMPPEAQKAESTLRKFGMGSLVDKAILSMNRAAEDATSGVGVIFADAIRQMTIADGIQILKGGDTAATAYLKQSTTSPLTAKMKPIIDQSLSKVNATSHWKDVFSAYNKLTRSNVNTDLSGYVTAKAMDGIFYSIAQEEKKIRKDPAGQASALIQKVFSNK